MKQYLADLQYVLENGRKQVDRTGTGTLSVFGMQQRYKIDLNAFPIVTTKKVNFDAILKELLWFLSGDTNNETLVKQGVNIWTPWAVKENIYPEFVYEIGGEKIPTIIDGELNPRAVEVQHLRDLNISATISTHEGNPLRHPRIEGEFTDQHHLDILLIENYTDRVAAYDSWGIKAPVGLAPIVAKGELGPVYGAMWRGWPKTGVDGGYIDQIRELMDGLKNKPYSRRHIVTGWNPEFLPDESKSHNKNILNGKQVLPPCHLLFQFHVNELTQKERINWYMNRCTSIFVDGKRYSPGQDITASRGYNEVIWKQILDEKQVPTQELSCQLYQRSMDMPLGQPYNITSYCLLTAMIAHCLNMATGDFIHTSGNTHIYLNQIDGVKTQLGRSPKKLPKLCINPNKRNIFSFTPKDFKLVGYEHDPFIKYEVAV